MGLGPKKRVMSRRRPKSAQKEICILQLKSERGMHWSELKEGTSRKFIRVFFGINLNIMNNTRSTMLYSKRSIPYFTRFLTKDGM